MRRNISNLLNRPFVRNVATVAGLTAVAQLITIGFAPIITRLYGPEAYGIQGLFTSVTLVLGSIAALTYPIAIVLPRDDADAFGLARLSMHIGLLMSLVVTVILFIVGHDALSQLNANELSAFMYLIPVSMFIAVASSVVGQWMIRKKAFFLTGKSALWQATLMNTAKVGLGLIQPSAAALVVTTTLGALIGPAAMLLGWRKISDKTRREERTSEPKVPNTLALAKHYSDFPRLRAPQVLINSISLNLPLVMLSLYFGPASVGLYAIAIAVLSIPERLIGGSFMQVFYPRINEAAQHGEDTQMLLIKATAGLALIGALPFLAVSVTGPVLFGIVFGSQWKWAGAYAQWLSIWIFFQFINRPAVSAIPVLGLQKWLLIYEIFSTGSKLLALYIGYAFFKSDIIAVALFSSCGIASYAWLIVWTVILSGRLNAKSKVRKI